MTEVFPASFGQQRLWLIDRLERAGAAYHVTVTLRMERGVDHERLQLAVDRLVQRHEALRTTFSPADDGVRQTVHTNVTVPLIHLDLAHDETPEESWRSQATAHAIAPFDLGHGPIMRAALYALPDQIRVLVLTIHHLAVDGWSEGVLIRDLAALYAGNGEDASLPPLPIQYADFAVWQREQSALTAAEDSAYWQRHLEGAVPTRLPADWSSDAAQRFAGRRRTVTLDSGLTNQIRAFCRREQTTIFLCGLAAFAVSVGRYSGNNDVVLATPVASRDRHELRDLVGFLANTVLLRLHLDPAWNAGELVAAVRTVCRESFAHAECPFERIVGAMRDSDAHGAPFHVMFAVQQPSTPEEAARLGWRVLPFQLETGTAKFELTLFLVDEERGLRLVAEYNSSAYEPQTIDAFLGACSRALELMAREPDRPIARWTLASQHDEEHLATHAIDTRGPSQRVDEYFDRQVSRAPDALAVVAGHERLTYAELHHRAGTLAARIVRASTPPPSVVAVLTGRTVDYVIAILGILKAGAAYLPIEEAQPDDRIAVALDEANVQVAIGRPPDRRFGRALTWIDPAALRPDDSGPATMRARGPDDLAYVMFTSGSTGRPKGVAVAHRNIAQLVVNPGYVSLGSHERVLHLAPSAFDASTFEVWAPLLNGGTVVIAPTTTPSFTQLGDLVASAGITTMWLTATFFNAVIDSAPSILTPVRQLLIGGEALSVPHVRRALASLPGTRIINGYGPTETTTFATTYSVPPDVDDRYLSIPIGYPLRETAVFVLDAHGNVAPRGARGMLYIAGGGVSRGYLNRPEETAAAFVSGVIPGAPDLRVFRTGDTARWRPDGSLQFLGRDDGQVKLRGMRIELGDIEAAIRTHPDVLDAAVVVRGTPGAERLAAYVVTRGSASDVSEIRRHVGVRLPDYMLPASFIAMAGLPRTAQGKLDRGALPEPVEADRTVDPPATPTEQRLADLWSQLLGTRGIGRHDDFFGLGGHSLLAARMSLQVNAHFGAEVPMEDFYRDASLAAIAARIDEVVRKGSARDRIVRRPRPAGSRT